MPAPHRRNVELTHQSAAHWISWLSKFPAGARFGHRSRNGSEGISAVWRVSRVTRIRRSLGLPQIHSRHRNDSLGVFVQSSSPSLSSERCLIPVPSYLRPANGSDLLLSACNQAIG